MLKRLDSRKEKRKLKVKAKPMAIMKGLPKRWVTETVKPTLTARVKRWEIMMDWLTHAGLGVELGKEKRKLKVKAKPMAIMKGLPKRWVTETVKPTLTARVKRWEIMMDWLT